MQLLYQNEILSIIVFIVSLILASVTYYYYLETRIVEFQIFSFFFMLAMGFSISTSLHYFLNDFQFENNINSKPSDLYWYNAVYYFSSILVPLNHYLLVLFWSRAMDMRFPHMLRNIAKILIIATLILYLPLLFEKSFYVNINFETLKLLRAWFFFAFVVLMGMIYIILWIELPKLTIFDNYKELTPIYKLHILTIWFVLGYVLSWTIKLIVMTYNYTQNNEIIVVDIWYDLGLLTATIAYTVFSFIALRHPHGVLIFQYQILRAHEIYKNIDSSSSRGTIRNAINQIVRYLEFVENLMKNQSQDMAFRE